MGPTHHGVETEGDGQTHHADRDYVGEFYWGKGRKRGRKRGRKEQPRGRGKKRERQRCRERKRKKR